MTLDYERWFAWIFPPSDDELQLRGRTEADFIERCTITTHHTFTAASTFRDPVIRAAIHTLKFHGNRRSARYLAALLEAAVDSLSLRSALFIPVPLSAARQRERGYNQVTRVLECSTLEFDTTIIERHQHTAPQTSVAKAERRQNVAQAFRLRNSARVANTVRDRHVVILDDVATTGATLSAVAAQLRPLPLTSLTCLALAH